MNHCRQKIKQLLRVCITVCIKFDSELVNVANEKASHTGRVHESIIWYQTLWLLLTAFSR